VKIIFWGTPKYAAENLINIVNAGYEVIAVVTQPDKRRGRGKYLSPSPVKQAAIDLAIPVYETKSIRNDINTKNLLFNLNADIYIVVAFGQILQKEILEKPHLGCWNSHASLLPVWRGAAPIQWSLINDDKKTGVCIMSMEEGLDTGPVIEQESIDILDTDNLEVLSSRLSNLSSKLLIKSLENIKRTKGLNVNNRLEYLKALDQSILNGKPSYARQIKKTDYLIDWNQKGRKIIKKIKGLYPNAYTFYKGKRIKIIEANLLGDENKQGLIEFNEKELPNKTLAGTVMMLKKQDGIIIMTKDIPIQIMIGQLEGKSKTDGYTLSIQSNLRKNDMLGKQIK